ncbi:hypothetical protein JN531_001790 [Flagellatimonas centrodinii]|uniref:P-II family nitrogen regulator n=1 Tax=Flagellatimonas centrodinii TaxID=2806210 RepID=UPI001FEFD695|nr:hypothetical protein [Flagellatimonas centrodinii]ULQ47027.1 hypothetical protein JN531_001790 [Flagellatimonas centrodinii]
MQTETRKLVTVICEAPLEARLIADIERLGARGYTLTEARGKGSRGVRDAGWDRNANLRLETLCDSATADAIAMHLRDHYYDHFAMIIFISDVQVLRSDKF